MSHHDRTALLCYGYDGNKRRQGEGNTDVGIDMHSQRHKPANANVFELRLCPLSYIY